MRHAATITVLSGGMGGARFLQGCCTGSAPGRCPASHPTPRSVVANTADDIWVHGLKVCPDLDTVMYTLGDGIDAERGWGAATRPGRQGGARGVRRRADWFGLGDRDLATHLVRTQMLDAGYPLSAVTEALCRRWQPGVRLLPMTDDRVETHVVVADPDAPRAPGRPLPGVLGAPARRGARRGRRRRRPGRRQARRPASWRPSPTPTSSCCRRPTRSSRSARSSASPASARRCARPRRRSSASPPSSAARTSAAWPTRCSPRSGSRSPPPASAGTTAARSTAACSTAGWSTRATRDHVAAVAAAGIACRGRAADDDRPRRHRGDGGGRPRPRARMSRLERHRARTALPEIAAGDDLAALIAAAGRRSPTATSSWSPARSSARPRAGSVRATGRRRWPRRPSGSSPAAGHPHRAQPAGLVHGRRRHRRLERRARARSCCCRVDPDASARGLRAALAELHRRQRRRRRHRHRRPGLARGPDRHRHRRGRAASSLEDFAGRDRRLRQPAGGHRARGRGRDRRRRGAGEGQARRPPGRRRPRLGPTWCCRAGDHGTGAAGPGAAPRPATCSGTAPARRSSGPWAGHPEDRRPFGHPCRPDELVDLLDRVLDGHGRATPPLLGRGRGARRPPGRPAGLRVRLGTRAGRDSGVGHRWRPAVP